MNRIRRYLGPTLLVLGAWTLVALISATSEYLAVREEGREYSWILTVLSHLPAWYMWAALTPFIFALTRRYPFRTGNMLKPFGIFLAVSIVWMAIYAVLTILYVTILYSIAWSALPEVIRKVLDHRWWIDYYVYWVIVAVAHAVVYYRRYLDRARAADLLKVRENALRHQLAESKLQFLRAQINPHFLFNTLNAVSAQIRKGENESANTLLAGLSDLLRRALDTEHRAMVPLGEELDFAGEFLKIQRTRFPNKLEFTVEVDRKAREVPVPGLLLQPLVENALEYGADAAGMPNTISIRGRVRFGYLCLDITNLAPEHEEDEKEGWGIGLSNTRGRLEIVYGEEYRLRMDRFAEERIRVRMLIPAEPPVDIPVTNDESVTSI